MKYYCIRIPEEHIQEMKVLAENLSLEKQENISIASLYRQAVKEFLEKNKEN